MMQRVVWVRQRQLSYLYGDGMLIKLRSLEWSPLPLTDPRDAMRRAHRAVHRMMSTVSVINCDR